MVVSLELDCLNFRSSLRGYESPRSYELVLQVRLLAINTSERTIRILVHQHIFDKFYDQDTL